MMPVERQFEQWPYRHAAMQRAAGPDRAGRALRLPHVKSNTLDSMGITQRKLNGNYLSWLDEATPEDLAEGALWYPVGHDWGQHMSDRYDVHPDKVYGVMSKTSPQRKWISRALNGQSNLGDTHNIISNYRHNPSGILTPGGISGSDNLKQSLRVMGADDNSEAILAAFMGDKKDRQIPKTLDFYHTLRDPEMGGAGNYMAQPAVADSWAGRSMLWTKNRWEDAHNGGRPLDYPGRGTGKGLDKPMVVKDFNRHTGKWEPVGLRPPSPTVIAARVLKYAGGYDRMRNAMRNGAAAHGLPFTHEGQAAVWKMISGNQNPGGHPVPDLDLHSIDHPEQLYNEQWLRRANGLLAPAASGFRLGSAPDTDEDPDDGSDDQWGTREDFLDVLKHISAIPRGWDAWEGRPMTRGPHHDPRIDAQRDQFPFRTANHQVHQDLAESHRAHGTVHSSCGRIIPGWKLAVADTATQQSRLADTAGWSHHVALPPSPLAVQGARAYASLKGFSDPHDTDYSQIMQSPERVARVGRHFDSLPVYSPEAVPHFAAMQREVNDQYDFLTNRMGIKVQPVDHDPYAHVGEMMADVNNNKTLKVLGSHITGGHPVFGNADNDKFRAVHDFFGHAATGRDFDRHGEHATYLAHSRMFSPQALPALTTETLGQNSSLILNGHFGPNKIGIIPRELTAHRTAGMFDNDEDEDEEFDGSYCQSCGKGDGDWCEDCETCAHCDDTHENHCKSCGPGDYDWCEDCQKCDNCDWQHDKHCSSCGPDDDEWCADCQQCNYCDGKCEHRAHDSRPTSLDSPLLRAQDRPMDDEYMSDGERMHLFLPHDVNPASEAISRPWVNFERGDDHDTPALDLRLPPRPYTNFDRPLREHFNGQENIPAGTKGAELYRGLMVDLKRPELAPLRRAIFGDDKESFYSGDSSSRYHPPKRRFEPRQPYQPGMFPGPYSDKELAAKPAHPDRLHQYLDLLLDHMSNHSTKHGLGAHWSTDIEQANQFSNASSSYNQENGHLPVRMKARWFGRGEDPYRRNTGEETPGDYDYEHEISMLPDAPLNLTDLEIFHPRTKQWHSLMDGDPRRVHAGKGKKKKSPRKPSMENPGRPPKSSPYYRQWRGPVPMWFGTEDGGVATPEDIFTRSDPRQLYQLLRTDRNFADQYREWLRTTQGQPEPGGPGREFIGFLQQHYPDVMDLLGDLK